MGASNCFAKCVQVVVCRAEFEASRTTPSGGVEPRQWARESWCDSPSRAAMPTGTNDVLKTHQQVLETPQASPWRGRCSNDCSGTSVEVVNAVPRHSLRRPPILAAARPALGRSETPVATTMVQDVSADSSRRFILKRTRTAAAKALKTGSCAARRDDTQSHLSEQRRCLPPRGRANVLPGGRKRLPKR